MTAEKYSSTYNVMTKNLSNNVLLILVGYFFFDTIFGLFFLCPSLADVPRDLSWCESNLAPENEGVALLLDTNCDIECPEKRKE